MTAVTPVPNGRAAGARPNVRGARGPPGTARVFIRESSVWKESPMATQGDIAPAEPIVRRDLIEAYRQTKAQRFQDLVGRDRLLAAQTILDPVGTLAKFGLLDPGDNDLSVQLTEGTLLDLIHLRETVAARGLVGALEDPAGPEGASARRAQGQVSVTLCWNRVCVTVTVYF